MDFFFFFSLIPFLIGLTGVGVGCAGVWGFGIFSFIYPVLRVSEMFSQEATIVLRVNLN